MSLKSERDKLREELQMMKESGHTSTIKPIHDASPKTLKRIRVSWKINGTEGCGLPFPLDQRKWLEGWMHRANRTHGTGTHWIEEIDV